MIYCIDETIDEPIMLINTHIGFDETDGMGIDGALFQKELLYLDTLGKKRIQVWINSVGGVVMDGYNIASAILKTKTPVDTYNVGVSASIAGVIFMCGRNRVAMDYSLLMIHKPSGGSDKKVLAVMQESLVKMLCTKSNLSIEQVNKLMDATSWLNADDCYKMGFVTEIEDSGAKNKKRMTTTNYVELFTEANKITNKILNPKNKSMLKVTNKLGLSDDATEEQILDSIAQIENKAVEDKEELNKVISEKEEALAIANKELEELKAQAETEKEAVIEKEAVAMVENFAKLGRIKNDEANIAKWVNLAKNDLDGTKSIIEDLPLNVTANTIEVENTAVVATPEDFLRNELKNINK
jgi:ATP-dependent protease ClpP protease subunit